MLLSWRGRGRTDIMIRSCWCHGQPDLLHHPAHQPAQDSSRLNTANRAPLPFNCSQLRSSASDTKCFNPWIVAIVDKINPFVTCSNITNNSLVASTNAYSCHKRNYTSIESNNFDRPVTNHTNHNKPGFYQLMNHTHHIKTGFYQLTNHTHHIKPGFYQLTNHIHHIKPGFYQLTYHTDHIEPGFYQLTNHTHHIKPGFHQLTNHTHHIKPGFYQLTNHTHHKKPGFYQLTNQSQHNKPGFYQLTNHTHHVLNLCTTYFWYVVQRLLFTAEAIPYVNTKK